MQFAGGGWGSPYILISGWDWPECTFGVLGEPEWSVPGVPLAFYNHKLMFSNSLHISRCLVLAV